MEVARLAGIALREYEKDGQFKDREMEELEPDAYRPHDPDEDHYLDEGWTYGEF